MATFVTARSFIRLLGRRRAVWVGKTSDAVLDLHPMVPYPQPVGSFYIWSSQSQDRR